MQVNTHEAKSQLSKLIDRALAGEEVIIARNNRPVIRLEAIRPSGGKRRLGSCPDLIESMAVDFDAPLDDFGAYMT